MKKRIIAAALISALLGTSLTGCGGTKENVSSEKPKEETPAVTTNSTESTASEVSAPESTVTEPVQSETTPTESEVEEVKEQLKLDITEQGRIEHGSWYFKADNNGTTENYLYNFADKKLVKFDVEEGYSVGDVSGYSVLLLSESDRITEEGSRRVYRAAGKLIDAASNSVLAEDLQFIPDQYLWSFFVDDTLLVGKHDASFSSATDSIGLMNSSGEWIYPLSSETALNDIEGFDLSSEKCLVINAGNDYVRIGDDFYSLKTNSIAKDTGVSGVLIEDQAFGIKNDYPGSRFCKYDFNTNELTDIAIFSKTAVDYFFSRDDAKNKTICAVGIIDGEAAVYDAKTDKTTKMTNISGQPLAFVNGILFCSKIEGADGKEYMGAYNLNSEFAFEPIRADMRSFMVNKIIPVGDKIIIKIDSPDSALYIFDTASNTLSTVEIDDTFDDAEFFAGDDDTVVIKKSVDGITYVLADIDDLTKTYSPFDSQ